MPGRSGFREVAAAGVADDRPCIQRSGRNQESNKQQRDSRKLTISAVLAESSARELHGARMGDPQNAERNHGGHRKRADTVEVHAEPRIQLPDFLPPLIVDGNSGERTGAQ